MKNLIGNELKESCSFQTCRVSIQNKKWETWLLISIALLPLSWNLGQTIMDQRHCHKYCHISTHDLLSCERKDIKILKKFYKNLWSWFMEALCEIAKKIVFDDFNLKYVKIFSLLSFVEASQIIKTQLESSIKTLSKWNKKSYLHLVRSW